VLILEAEHEHKMSIIHELREDYRYYRSENPQFRLLFLLGDLLGLLFRLALFAAFVYLCWYIVSRNPVPEQQPAADLPTPTPTPMATTPELTAGRIALLEKIASQGSTTASGLVGSVESSPADLTAPGTEDRVIEDRAIEGEAETGLTTTPESEVPALIENQSDLPLVQVESQTGFAARSGYVEVDEIPTVYLTPTDGEPAGDFFRPAAPIESSGWLRKQIAEYYTIQLALTVNVDFLVEFAELMPAEHVAAIYPEKRISDNNLQYSLSLGSFPDLQEAEEALSSLPNNFKRYGAHARLFGDIQKNLDILAR